MSPTAGRGARGQGRQPAHADGLPPEVQRPPAHRRGVAAGRRTRSRCPARRARGRAAARRARRHRRRGRARPGRPSSSACSARAIWLLAWLVGRRWRKWPAYLIGFPFFMVALFFFFEEFSRLLPELLSRRSAPAEHGAAALAEGRDALLEVVAPPRRVPRRRARRGRRPDRRAISSRLRASFAPARVSGASAAISSAQPRAASRSPRRCTKPEPVRLLAAAGLGAEQHRPGRARRRRGATAAGSTSGRPSARAWRPGTPNRAAGVATRRSHATASWVPAPSAAPSTAARCGRGSSRSVASTSRSRSVKPGVLHAGQVGAGAEVAAGAGEHDDARALRRGRAPRAAGRAPRGRGRCAARPGRS